MSSVKSFTSFFPAILLNTLRFNSSVLFRTHTLLDKPLSVIKLPTHLSNLTAINSSEFLDCVH